jgi:hypothetical protein
MKAIKDKLNESRKAVVAAATPGVVLAINAASDELSKQASGWITLVAGSLLVYLTRNKPASR